MCSSSGEIPKISANRRIILQPATTQLRFSWRPTVTYRVGLFSVIAVLILSLTFCGGGSNSSNMVTVPDPAPTPSPIPDPTPAPTPPGPTYYAVLVTPMNSSMVVGATQQFKATGIGWDASMHDLTSSVTWSASPAALVGFSTAGNLTAVTSGNVTVTAAYSDAGGSTSGSTSISIAAAPASITISPASASIAVAGNQQFSVTGTYADGSTTDLTSYVHWSTSDIGVASASNQSGWQGLVTGRSAGTATVTATAASIGSQASISVAAPPVGQFVYEMNLDATISEYRTTSTGALVANGYVYTGGVGLSCSYGCGTLLAGRFLFVEDAYAGLLRAYTLDTSTGLLTASAPLVSIPMGPQSTSPALVRPVAAASNRFLYVPYHEREPTGKDMGKIYGYTIGADGSLNPVPGSPFADSSPNISGNEFASGSNRQIPLPCRWLPDYDIRDRSRRATLCST